jgi:hypothetical protein
MNRRKALFTTLASAALLPARLVAQTVRTARTLDDEPTGGFRRARNLPAGSVATRKDAAGELIDEEPAPKPHPADVGMPADFPVEPGQVFRGFDISKYTSLPHEATNPQDALVEWIFRRTGSGIWHGDRIAVLSAGRAQVRAYHTPKVLKQVEEVVERFVEAQPSDYIKLRVRFCAASDPKWRYLVGSRLAPVAAGPHGQQVWSVDVENAAFLRTQMQVNQGFKMLEDREIKMINGQTLNVAREADVDYIVGPQRDSAAGLGYQPGTAKLKEGIYLRVSPLYTFEGDAVDLALDLQAVTVKSKIATKILTRREIGPSDMTIEVPEVVETRLNRSIEGWKLGNTLLISAGIHPGILQSKAGWMKLGIPGTAPTRTEVLVFLDAEPVNVPPPRSNRARREDDDEDIPPARKTARRDT